MILDPAKLGRALTSYESANVGGQGSGNENL